MRILFPFRFRLLYFVDVLALASFYAALCFARCRGYPRSYPIYNFKYVQCVFSVSDFVLISAAFLRFVNSFLIQQLVIAGSTRFLLLYTYFYIIIYLYLSIFLHYSRLVTLFFAYNFIVLFIVCVLYIFLYLFVSFLSARLFPISVPFSVCNRGFFASSSGFIIYDI